MYALDMAVLGGHHKVSRLLQALHWASNKEDIANRDLLQSAVKREMLCIDQERASRQRHYQAVTAYDSWQERKNIKQIRVDPGACQYRLEQRNRQSTTKACSTCEHSRVTSQCTSTVQKCRVKPINISLTCNHEAIVLAPLTISSELI